MGGLVAGGDEAEAGKAGSCRALDFIVKEVGSHLSVLSRGVTGQLNTLIEHPGRRVKAEPLGGQVWR